MANPIDSPAIAANVPMRMTTTRLRSPLAAKTPPRARITSPGTSSPMKIERSMSTAEAMM